MGQQRTETDTATLVLDVAERLVQTRGFNGFSYADVAGELGITKAGLHYHFATKADLGEALIVRYAVRFAAALDRIDAREATARSTLDDYVELYAGVLEGGRMCLCGMLAADNETLPEPMQQAVQRFFADNETWLRAVLERGEREGSMRLARPAGEVAGTIVGALEGAMLIARVHGDVGRFRPVAAGMLAGVAGLPA